MKSRNLILSQISSFISKMYYIDTDTMNEDTRIEEDLLITGDEALEFIIEYGKEFDVNVSSFMAADYFEAEGFVDFLSPLLELLRLKKKRGEKKALTIKHLVIGIKAGKLDEEVISLKQ